MRSQYKALQQKRADLLAEASTILDAPLTDESRARHDAIKAEVEAIDGDLARYEQQFEAERRAPALAGARATVTPVAQDPMRGFATASDFAWAVRAACHPSAAGRVDPRLAALHEAPTIGAAPTNYHQEGHSAEGYMVPPAIQEQIWELVFAEDDLVGMVFREETDRNSVNWTRDETTPWGATGIQARWRAEAAQMTASKLVTDPSQLRIHELYAFATATEEELEDAPLTNSRLVRGAARAIQWKASDALMRGTGAGQPLGWLNAPSLITVTKEGGQAAATIVAKNIVKMYARRFQMPGSRWTWLANSDIVPQLVDLKIGNEPSWTGQNAGLRDAPSGVLLGIPIRFTEHCATLGTIGDLQLADLAGYYALVRAGGVRFASSIHLYFDYNVSAFRWTFRLGGQPFLSAAVSPANGTTTKSHFIVLETRS